MLSIQDDWENSITDLIFSCFSHKSKPRQDYDNIKEPRQVYVAIGLGLGSYIRNVV